MYDLALWQLECYEYNPWSPSPHCLAEYAQNTGLAPKRGITFNWNTSSVS